MHRIRSRQAVFITAALIFSLLSVIVISSSSVPLSGTAAGISGDVRQDVPPAEPPPEQPPADPAPVEQPPADPLPAEQPPADPPPEEQPPADPAPVEQPPADPLSAEQQSFSEPLPEQQPLSDPLPSMSCAFQIEDGGDSSPFTYRLVSSVTGVDSLEWLISGSSVSTAPTFDYTFPAVGTYDILLRCTSAALGTQEVSGSITIASLPEANFSITPGNAGTVPYTIYTVNSSTGPSLTYSWEIIRLADSQVIYTSTSSTISYTFTEAGIYRVRLIASSGGNNSILERDVTVEVQPPKANFTVTPTSGTSPLNVTIQGVDEGGGPIDSWSWDFNGDSVTDATGIGPHPYTYTALGSHTIRLSYSNANGSGTAQRTITVVDNGNSLTALFDKVSQTNTVDGIRVCFSNTSTGVITQNTWTFGDGSAAVIDNGNTVCHTYTEGGTYTVRLEVRNGQASAQKQTSYTIIGAPTAIITASATSITWGGTVNFSGVNSTGLIDTYEWDFNADGVFEVTGETVNNVAIGGNVAGMRLGANPVRLKVTGPGGTAYTEIIILVNRLELTCDFTGVLSTFPGAQTYTSAVGSVNGRTVTYHWQVSGPGGNRVFSTQNLSYTFPLEGSYTVTMSASTPDGANCSTSKTVTVAWPTLECTLSNTGLTPVPNGTSYTYTTTVTPSTIAGRTLTYDWYIGATLVQSGSSNTYSRSWTSAAHNTSEELRVVVTPSSGSPCQQTRTLNIAYPQLQCSLSGTFNPRPNGTGYTYTVAPVAGTVYGRTITYQWYINGNLIPGETGTSLTRSWPATANNTSETLRVVAVPSVGQSCEQTQPLSIAWPPLTCSISGSPTGYTTPRPNMPSDPSGVNNYTYNFNVDAQGRSFTRSWTYNGGPAQTTASTTQNWDYTQIGTTHTFALTVVADNGDGTTESCNKSLNVTVTMPALQVATPSGDTTPVVGEEVVFGSSVTNLFGRTATITWTFERWNGTAWVGVQTSVPGSTFAYRFNTPSERYRVRYTATASQPSQSKTSSWAEITVAADTRNFTCDAGLTGTSSIPGTGGNYTYNITVDNTTGLNLRYTWVLVDRNNVERVLGANDSAIDGVVTSPAFTGAQLGPIGDYTLRADVAPVVSTDSTYRCSKSIALQVGSANVSFTQSVTPGNIAVGQSICLTNTSTSSHGDISTLNYTWSFGTASNSLGAATSTSAQPGCLSFTAEGTYIIRLTGTNGYGDRTASAQVTYNVYFPQGIVLERTDSREFAGSSFGFRATGTNINSYKWNIYRVSDNTRVGSADRTGTTLSQVFASPGQYRVNVVGTGPLGTTTAELMVNVLGVDDVRAAFIPSQYAGIAPLRVCFTDNSAGNNLNQWTWDFGNGSTQTYTTPPAEICTDYTTAGQSHEVRLTVRNAAGNSATATNVVRTYADWESSSSFSITPMTASRYCFSAVLPAGVSLQGWSFGDGSTINTTADACHDFQASGVYLVTMRIGDGVRTGQIVRTVTVTPTVAPQPSLQVSQECTAERTARFTITNTGAAMTRSDQVMVRNQLGTIIYVGSIQLGANASQTFSFPNQSGMVTLTTADTRLNVSTTCEYPPQISVDGLCLNAVVTFRISNADGPMHRTQSYEIRSSTDQLITSGTFQLARGAAPVDIPLTGQDPYDTYRFISSDYAGTFNVSRSCGTRPQLVISGICSDPVRFTIRNDGGSMQLAQSFSVADSSSRDVTPSPNSFQLSSGQSTTVTLANGLDPYLAYTLSTSGFAGTTSHTQDCFDPSLTVMSSCAIPLTFVIENNGREMLSPQSFTVEDANGLDVTPATNTFQLAAGASTTVSLTGLDPYVGYTLRSSGYAGTLNDTRTCTRPVLTGTYDCATFAFTVTNTGGAMAGNHAYQIFDGSGANVTPANSVLRLAAGASTQIAIPTGADPYGARLVFTEFGVRYERLMDCARPVTLSTETPTPTPTPTEAPEVDGVSRLNWSAVPTCGRGCPDFRLYHTDETGDWEIFRLDGADKVARTSQRENLSLGAGEGVDDMAPSLSPNQEWIVFTSNRASLPDQPENWEIYVAPTSGGDPTAVQRVTYNTLAIDTDPVWGPNNWVVFETNRNGNWDLYAVDMFTGVTYALTSALTDEINPFWSPDGRKLVYQSNASGFWQIDELDLWTGVVRRLSDGTGIDVDPAYSFGGEQIAFRTYTADDDRSRIALMTADGANRRLVTEAEENATNHAWSPNDALIAYQSDRDGDLDIYIYQVADGTSRKVTDNAIPDYAPTWRCAEDIVIFTSDIAGNPDIYEEEALPIEAPAVLVEEAADQMTFELVNDIYPQVSPAEENASREGRTTSGIFGEQTSFLQPDVDPRPADFSLDGLERDDWADIEGCPAE